jgi:hypothetical protein
MYVCLTVVGLHGEKKIVKETRALADDPFCLPFMLTEQMRVGVRKNGRKDCEQEKRECITHGVRSHACHKFTSIHFLFLHPLAVSSLL